MPTQEWAQKYLSLPEEGADLPGPYRLEYTPYFYGIFAAFDERTEHDFVMQKAAQVGWTYALIAYLLKRVHTDPCPAIVMFATEGAAEDFSSEKLEPTIRATDVIMDRIDMSGARNTGNRALFKKFPGGFLKLGSSNAIRSVKSTPAALVVVEEPDDANANVKEQGDSVKLLFERTKTMRNAKRILGGTPSVKGFSRVEKHINLSDKRVLPIECHECGEFHVLDFDNVSWLSDSPTFHQVYGTHRPDTAVYCCPLCGAAWDDYQRKENIRRTVMNAIEAGDPYCGWTPTADYNGVVGFMNLGEVYSCLPGANVASLARDYLAAEHAAENGDETDRIVFINSKRGEPYSYESDNATAETLEERALDYNELECPAGGLIVTWGIDVQHDRLALVARAWGIDEESFLLYWDEIPAEQTMISKKDAAWSALNDLVFAPIPHELGGRITASAITIDASDGTTSDAVYSWVRQQTKKRPNVTIMAGKGSSVDGAEIFALPTKRTVDHQDPKKKTKADKHGVKVYIIGVNKGKDLIVARQKLDGYGPGRMHCYKGVRNDYFEQVTSEVKAPKKNAKGLVWQKKPGVRNEAFDCENYALHAAYALNVHRFNAAKWAGLAARATRTATNTPKPKTRNVARKNDGTGWINTSGEGWFK